MRPDLDVGRFLAPQSTAYPDALAELQQGQKRTHWMWFIFTQLRGLGRSDTAWFYGIADLDEAKAYLAHPVLGERLHQISSLLLTLPQKDAGAVFGYTDAMKLRSSMTLFALAEEGDNVFRQVLQEYFRGNLTRQHWNC